MANEDLPIEETPSAIKLWKVTPYKDAMLYIRSFPQVGSDIFEYLVVWKKNLYTDYMAITPSSGNKELTNAEANTAYAWILIAAQTTVDTLRGEEVQGEKRKEAQEILNVLEETAGAVQIPKEKKVN